MAKDSKELIRRGGERSHSARTAVSHLSVRMYWLTLGLREYVADRGGSHSPTEGLSDHYSGTMIRLRGCERRRKDFRLGLVGRWSTLLQTADDLPQTLALRLRDPNESQPECLAAHPLHTGRVNLERPFDVRLM